MRGTEVMTMIPERAADWLGKAGHSLVGSEWVRGSESKDVLNPATGLPLLAVSLASVDQCMSAVDAAEQALPAWSDRSPRARADVLMRCYALLMDNADAIAYLIASENGKALADARSEAVYAAEFFRWYAEEAVRVPGDLRRSPAGGNWIMVSHEPVGVSLLITPWNFPAAMATRKIAPALAAGCTVILKPALETPITALFIAALLEEAGVPPGVVNVVLASPPGPAVTAMLGDRRVRALSFTGSTEVGRLLLGQAAGSIAKSSMELGGNAPFLVFDDADLDEAVDGFMLAKFRNGGSACTAANRILLQAGIADDFILKATDRVAALRVGDGLRPGVDVGAMVSAVERDRVARLVDDAIGEGARLVWQHQLEASEGYFYPPTILDEVRTDSPIARSEIFGPVVAIQRFATQDEGIRLANDTDAGLVSYLYTSDLQRGFEVGRRLQAGMIGLNRGLVSDPAAPFGGIKESGIGREGAREGMLEFMETKYTAAPYL